MAAERDYPLTDRKIEPQTGSEWHSNSVWETFDVCLSAAAKVGDMASRNRNRIAGTARAL